jgi:hypothetical protein
MTQFLPPNLLALFAARDPIPFMLPVDKPTHEKKRQPYTGVADYLTHFEVSECCFYLGIREGSVRAQLAMNRQLK